MSSTGRYPMGSNQRRGAESQTDTHHRQLPAPRPSACAAGHPRRHAAGHPRRHAAANRPQATRVATPQATRKGWPYYIRELRRQDGSYIVGPSLAGGLRAERVACGRGAWPAGGWLRRGAVDGATRVACGRSAWPAGGWLRPADGATQVTCGTGSLKRRRMAKPGEAIIAYFWYCYQYLSLLRSNEPCLLRCRQRHVGNNLRWERRRRRGMRRLSLKILARATARTGSLTIFSFACRQERYLPCWGQTGRARLQQSRRWRVIAGPTRERCACWGWIPYATLHP